MKQGLQPKIRPLVSGTMPMKNLGNNLLNSDQARKARAEKGVSTKNGCDKNVHTLIRGAYLDQKALVLLVCD